MISGILHTSEKVSKRNNGQGGFVVLLVVYLVIGCIPGSFLLYPFALLFPAGLAPVNHTLLLPVGIFLMLTPYLILAVLCSHFIRGEYLQKRDYLLLWGIIAGLISAKSYTDLFAPSLDPDDMFFIAWTTSYFLGISFYMFRTYQKAGAAHRKRKNIEISTDHFDIDSSSELSE